MRYVAWEANIVLSDLLCREGEASQIKTYYRPMPWDNGLS
jgi:hypothetical protein